MPDVESLKSDINNINIDEPKYLRTAYDKREESSLSDRINELDDIIFIHPKDPWIMVNDSLVRLPFSPEGYGISMKVHARTLAGIFGKTKIYVGDEVLPLTRLLTEFNKGAIISYDGSVYIADKKCLSKLTPPSLDDPYRILTSFFTDEDLFEPKIITDPFGYKRQAYNQVLAIKSLALSKSSYNMRIKQFIMDGWLDYTLVYEGEIKSTEEDWVTKPSTGKQFIISIKQLITTQSIKAVVMGKPTSDGGAIINITFTGTKHATDWLNNIKVGVSNELHKGFYELALVFDSLVDKINMPRLAGVLGVKNLSLDKIFEEGKKKNSRYKFWITGHSQGGSLTQIYIAEFMMKRGICAENIFGYSFASPTVATTKYSQNPANYPVYNIINADDLAVRVGSSVRLGLDMVYMPEDSFRQEKYIGYKDSEKKGMFDDILRLCYWLTDSFKFGEFMIAMATFATQSPGANNFKDWLSENPLLKSLYDSFANSKDFPKLIQDKMYKMLEKPYMDIGGNPPSEDRILLIRQYLEILYKKWGMQCMREYMYSTHEIPHGYSLIVTKPESELIKCIWTLDIPAKLISPENKNLMEDIPFPQISIE